MEGGAATKGGGAVGRRERIRRIGAALLVSGVFASSGFTSFSQITVRVWDNGSAKDDRAKVYVNGVQLIGAEEILGDGSGYTRASADGTTWDLGRLPSGVYTLTVEHAQDIDAPISGDCAEVVGTYGIEFGGGGVTAVDDEASTDRGRPVIVNVLANDLWVEAGATATDVIPCPSERPAPTDPCGCAERTTFTTTFEVLDSAGSLEISGIVDPPVDGSAQISPDRRSITYVPGSTACGSDSFEYEVGGPGGAAGTARVTVWIDNAVPIAEPDAYTTVEGEPLSVGLPGVLGNDLDPNGDALTAVVVSLPRDGLLTLRPDGTFVYRPNPRFFGSDSFQYSADDGCGTSIPAEVVIEILRANRPPVADAGGFYEGRVGEPIRLDASRSFDPDFGDRLEYRWDLDSDWYYDTDWLEHPSIEIVWDAPYDGPVTLEVRDLRDGDPTGTRAEDAAWAAIRTVQQIRAVVFEDIDHDGIPGATEPRIPGVALWIGGRSATTGGDGEVLVSLDPGSWIVRIESGAADVLRGRGYEFSTVETTVQLEPGATENVAFGAEKTRGTLKGVVFHDLDRDGLRGDEEPGIGGLIVTLDGGRAVRTDEEGRFAFPGVSFGERRVRVNEPNAKGVEWMLEFDAASRDRFELPWTDETPAKGFLEVDVRTTRGER